MWWYFSRILQNGHMILYAYSRESKDLDGKIMIDLESNDVDLVNACEADKGSHWAQKKALEKALWLLQEGCPDTIQIACG